MTQVNKRLFAVGGSAIGSGEAVRIVPFSGAHLRGAIFDV